MKAACNPEFYDLRANTFLPIEVVILSGVNEIESRYPANHAGREHQRRNINPPGLRDPRADWSDRQRKSEKEMCRAGEPFRERVEKNHKQRDRGEQERQAIDCRCRC